MHTLNLLNLENLTPKQRQDYILNLLKSDKDFTFSFYLFLVYDKLIDFKIQLKTKEKTSLLKTLPASADDKNIDIKKVNTLLVEFLSKVRSRKTFQSFLEYLKNKNLTYGEVYALIKALDKNLGIGYKKIAEYFAKYCDRESFKKYVAQQLNWMQPDFIIPYFPFSLAEKFDKFNKMKDDILNIQPKYDGIRAVIFKNYLLTRNHEYVSKDERPYLKSLIDEVNMLQNYLEEKIYFDGEIFYQNFNTTMSLISQENEKYDYNLLDKLVFYIFDFVPEYFVSYDFKYNVINDIPLEERQKYLSDKVAEAIKKLNLKQIQVVPSKMISKADFINEGDRILNTYLNFGYEGIMIKGVRYPYIGDRGAHWLKLKPVNEIEGVIRGFKEGEGKYKNMLGALEVEINGGLKVFVSGMDDNLRKEIWGKRDMYLNKIVDVVFQEFTPSGSLRFPRIKRIRLDKTLEIWNKEE